MTYEPTRIPAELNDEDAFFSVGEIKFSLRQVLTLLLAAGGWYLIGGSLFGVLIHSRLLGLLLFSPLLVAGALLAFARKNGVTYEEWLSSLLLFRLESRRYSIVGQRRGREQEDVDEAPPAEVDWEFDEEDDFIG